LRLSKSDAFSLIAVTVGLVGVLLGARNSAAADAADAPDAPATTAPSTQPAKPVPTLDPAIALAVRRAVAENTLQRSLVVGGAFTNRPLEDFSRDGVLVGFRIGLGLFFQNEVIKRVEPIYLTRAGEHFGRGVGDRGKVTRWVLTKAPPGYAVGALQLRGGGGLDGITVKYMQFNGTRLDPTETRSTARIGMPGGSEQWIDGDGTPIVGIVGRIDDKSDWLGLGVIFEKPTAMVR
jgi:hypothetical protein